MTYTIALDCDGVLYAWEKTARYMLRRKYALEGREIPPALYQPSAHWDAILGIVPTEDWKWLWSEGITQGLFRYGHGEPGFIEGAQALAELGDVILVTSRPKSATNDTLAWAHLMLNKVPLAGIRILSHSEPKSTVDPAPNLFIDDAIHNVDDIVDNTRSHVRAILFDQPWNQGYEHAFGLDAKWKRGMGWPHTVLLAQDAKDQLW